MKKSFNLIPIAIIFAAVFLFSSCSVPLKNPDRITYNPISLNLPKPERVELENGIILYVLEDHELPLVNVSAIVRTGSIYDFAGKEGLAEITGTGMRTGGTKHLTGDEIDEELDYIAGKINISIGNDSGSASLSVLKKDLDTGLNIFSDIIINPVFEKEKLELAKSLMVEDLRRLHDNPQRMAFREIVRILYDGNPRGRLSSIKSIEKISRSDLVKFHKDFFYPGNIMMAVTGDITKDEAVSRIHQYFGKWNASGKIKDIPVPEKKEKGSLNYIYKDISQSILILGQLAPGIKNPDYYAFEVLDFILGSGGFRSRIFRKVRNDLGLAYSTGSFYSSKPEFGVFGAYSINKASATGEVLDIVTSIIGDAKKGEITAQELEWAKHSLINSFVFSFSSIDQIALQQMQLEYDKLPKDFFMTYRNNIEKVSLEDLKRVAALHLPDECMVTLILGNETHFDRALTDFGEVNIIQGGLYD